MAHQYWYGLEWQFVCSLCCITSVEKAVINSTTNDTDKIKASINRQSLTCLHCSAPLGHGTDVDVKIVPGTPEYLQSLGFALPTEEQIRRRNGSNKK
jgi:hypothetical protein